MLYSVNIGIFIVMAFMLVYALYTSNSIVSKKFALERKRTEVRQLGTELAAKQNILQNGQDMQSLVSLSQRLGMVSGDGGDTLWANELNTAAMRESTSSVF